MDGAARRLALALVFLIVAACAAEQPKPAVVSAQARPAAAHPTAPAISAATFVSTSGSIELFIIRSSELALERSSSRRVLDFASMLIRAHQGTSAQLSLAGRRLNLLPAAVLQPREQALFAELQQAPNFDAAYVRDQRLVHQQALALDKSYAAAGDSPTLRPVAAAAIPIIQRHLAMLAYL